MIGSDNGSMAEQHVVQLLKEDAYNRSSPVPPPRSYLHLMYPTI